MHYSPEYIRDKAWKLAGNVAGGTILDIGSGDGNWLRRLRAGHSGRLLSVDVVDAGARAVADDFQLCNAARERLPWPDESVNCAFAVEVLEHLENPRHAIREISRVLKPGGWFFLTTPNCEDFASRISFLLRGYFPAFADHNYLETGHITPITRVDLRRIAKEAGLSLQLYNIGRGRVPGTGIHWPKLLRGMLWSDTLGAMLTKPSSDLSTSRRN